MRCLLQVTGCHAAFGPWKMPAAVPATAERMCNNSCVLCLEVMLQPHRCSSAKAFCVLHCCPPLRMHPACRLLVGLVRCTFHGTWTAQIILPKVLEERYAHIILPKVLEERYAKPSTSANSINISQQSNTCAEQPFKSKTLTHRQAAKHRPDMCANRCMRADATNTGPDTLEITQRWRQHSHSHHGFWSKP
jgi:hypothetical protein